MPRRAAHDEQFAPGPRTVLQPCCNPDQDTMTVADTGLMNIHQQCNTTGMVGKSSAHALALDYCTDVELSKEIRFLSDDSVTLNNAEKQLWTACSWDARFAELLKVFPMSS